MIVHDFKLKEYASGICSRGFLHLTKVTDCLTVHVAWSIGFVCLVGDGNNGDDGNELERERGFEDEPQSAERNT